MKLMGGSSTRRPPPPALPPPRPVMVVDLKLERSETRGFERRSFEIEGQVSKAGSCRVELVTLGCVARSLSRSLELGGRDACRLTESGAKIIAGPNTMFGRQLEGWGAPAIFRGPEEGGHMQLQAERNKATRTLFILI